MIVYTILMFTFIGILGMASIYWIDYAQEQLQIIHNEINLTQHYTADESKK